MSYLQDMEEFAAPGGGMIQLLFDLCVYACFQIRTCIHMCCGQYPRNAIFAMEFWRCFMDEPFRALEQTNPCSKKTPSCRHYYQAWIGNSVQLQFTPAQRKSINAHISLLNSIEALFLMHISLKMHRYPVNTARLLVFYSLMSSNCTYIALTLQLVSYFLH